MKVFKEEQQFRQTWFILLMLISMIVPTLIMLNEYLKEDGTLSLTSFLSILGMMLLLLLPIFFFKLKTRIDENGIHYQFFPFHFSYKTILWNEIIEAYVRNYDPIGEYGGWGLKGGWSSKKGKAINISGDEGIQLVLRDQSKLLIGTKRKDDATRVLRSYQSKFTENA